MNAPLPTGFSSDSRKMVFRVFFFGVFIFLLYQLGRILQPFFSPILVAITLALVFYPVHARFFRWFRNRENAAAAASVSSIFLIVILPLIFFSWILGREATRLYPWAQQQIEMMKSSPEESFESRLSPRSKILWERTSQFLDRWEIEPREIVLKNLDELGTKLSATSTRLIKNTLFLIFHTFVTLFTLFFLFRDGKKILHRVVNLVPMEIPYKEHILTRLDQTLSAVVRGMFLTALVQGFLAGIGYTVVGIRFSVLLAFATAFTALIPFVGATAIWLPVGIVLLLKGSLGAGVGLLLWGFFVVSLVDNFLRPILIGEKAKLPIFLLFFGTLGGLQVYGVIGLLLGPLMIASVLAFAKIYQEQLQLSSVKKETLEEDL